MDNPTGLIISHRLGITSSYHLRLRQPGPAFYANRPVPPSQGGGFVYIDQETPFFRPTAHFHTSKAILT